MWKQSHAYDVTTINAQCRYSFQAQFQPECPSGSRNALKFPSRSNPPVQRSLQQATRSLKMRNGRAVASSTFVASSIPTHRGEQPNSGTMVQTNNGKWHQQRLGLDHYSASDDIPHSLDPRLHLHVAAVMLYGKHQLSNKIAWCKTCKSWRSATLNTELPLPFSARWYSFRDGSSVRQ